MFVENFLRDTRIGARVLAKEKSFCALAILVLALGIAGVTTMFSVVDAVMLRGFSFPHADRLMGIQVVDITKRTANVVGFGSQIFTLDYEDMRAQQKSFERLAAYISGATVNLTVDGNPQRLTGAYVTEDFFRILGVAPVIGRDFTAADNRAGAPKIALISHQLWQRNFGGSDDVIGRAVHINGMPATIVGVMPPGFSFPSNEEIWVPLYSEYPPRPRNDRNAQGGSPAVLGLLRPGVPIDQASAEFTTIAQHLATTYPDTNKNFATAIVAPLIHSFTPAAIRGLLWIMLLFCVGILLIACVNVTNMQFARAALRTRELAVRTSLGATRWRLVRQMLTENLLLATLGALAGVAIALWTTDYLQAVTHNQENPIPSYIRFEIDGRVLVFVIGATMLAAVVSGLVPAWFASRTNPVEALKESGRGNTSRAISLITRGLVVFQIAVTSFLLIGALLEAQSVVHQQRLNYGYDTSALLSARMALMEGAYPTPEARKLFFDRLLRELRSGPEFEAAALTNRFRMTFSGNVPIEIEGHSYKTDNDRPQTNFEQVTENYFATLGSKVLEGRDFALDDSDARQPVAIVNSDFAAKHFPHESALGRRFRTVANNGQLFGPWRRIVGVVQTTRMQPPFDIPGTDTTGFYLPYYSTITGPAQAGPSTQQFATLVVRPRNNGKVQARSLATALQRAVNRVDPNLPLYFVGTPRENQDTFIAQNRIIGVMFTIFGLVAMVLASVGLYGVMSFAVSQRMQEFGIRMALGADNQRILRMVLGQSGVQLGLGLVLGLAVTALIGSLARDLIGTQLFQISPTDPMTYGSVALLLALVALIATFVPARRATRVDPMVALRAE